VSAEIRPVECGRASLATIGGSAARQRMKARARGRLDDLIEEACAYRNVVARSATRSVLVVATVRNERPLWVRTRTLRYRHANGCNRRSSFHPATQDPE
jgi:hypothetical protein